MNLVIDIGNSRTKIAVFQKQEIIHDELFEALHEKDLYRLQKKYSGLNQVIISSVKDYRDELKSYLGTSFETFIELSAKTPLPLINRYDTPATLGKDRLAAVVGATVLFPGKNVLVIDAGTAITYEVITAQNEYLGGNISPGLQTRFRALHHFTGRLPLSNINEEANLIGKSTESAIQAGVQYGLLFEIEKYIEHFNTIYENLEIIITGGDAKFFDKKLKNSIFVNFNLTLIGLNRILEYNVK